MKKVLRQIVMLVIPFILAGCNLYPENELEFLNQNFDDTFTNETDIKPPENCPDMYAYELKDYSYKSFDAEKLGTKIKVRRLLSSTVVPCFETNYDIIKAGFYYSDQISEIVKNDFSDVNTVFNNEWVFNFTTYSGLPEYTEEYSRKQTFADMKRAYFINVTETELPDLEKRLKAFCYDLHENGWDYLMYEKCLILVNTSGVKFDSSKLVYSDIDGDLLKSFDKVYSLNNFIYEEYNSESN